MGIAFLCPGQGSQAVGMGADLVERHLRAREIYAEADAVLGWSLSDVSFQGPEERLKDTRYTQPALFVHSFVCGTLLGEKGIAPDYLAGHSLGEYSALALAGAIPFAEGLRLVVRRAQCMAEAGTIAPGAMAAVIGLDDEVVESAVEGIDDVVVANLNAPGQVVISGSEAGIAEASRALQDAGAKRVLPLQVSGAFHSPLMEPAVKDYADAVMAAQFVAAGKPVIANVTARPVTDPDEIRDLLVRQMISPVRWTESVRTLASLGVDTAYEVGPGNVLQGLVRRIEKKGINVIAAGQAEQIDSL